MSYGHLDSNCNNSLWLTIFGKMSGKLMKPAINLATLLLDKPLLPYMLIKKIVQMAVALSYIYGTVQRTKVPQANEYQ